MEVLSMDTGKQLSRKLKHWRKWVSGMYSIVQRESMVWTQTGHLSSDAILMVSSKSSRLNFVFKVINKFIGLISLSPILLLFSGLQFG